MRLTSNPVLRRQSRWDPQSKLDSQTNQTGAFGFPERPCLSKIEWRVTRAGEMAQQLRALLDLSPVLSIHAGQLLRSCN